MAEIGNLVWWEGVAHFNSGKKLSLSTSAYSGSLCARGQPNHSTTPNNGELMKVKTKAQDGTIDLGVLKVDPAVGSAARVDL